MGRQLAVELEWIREIILPKPSGIFTNFIETVTSTLPRVRPPTRLEKPGSPSVSVHWSVTLSPKNRSSESRLVREILRTPSLVLPTGKRCPVSAPVNDAALPLALKVAPISLALGP